MSEETPITEIEVLPPEKSNDGTLKSVGREELRKKAAGSKWLSWLLDECIRIPGTQIRFGLDPIIGLIPGGGDTIATIMGAFVLGDAGRKGLPFKTLIKMGGNMLLNACAGAIPGFGDFFSAWFKSNSRNVELMQDFLESEEGQNARGGWWPVLLILAILGIVIAVNIASYFVFIALVSWGMNEIKASL